MIVYPAIDLSDGQCVRLLRGERDQKTVYDPDPAAVARRWAAAGAAWLHVVDLDGAFEGEPRNLNAVRAIVDVAGVPVQVGGGIRSLSTIERYRQRGVARVILGTAAVCDRAFCESALREHGEAVVIDIGARDGRVAVQGWAEVTDQDAVAFAQTIAAAGAHRVVFTDAASDGTLEGPNLPALRRMAEALTIPVIASGGIATIDDVRAVAELAGYGIEGLIIGRALYEGTLHLAEALAVATDTAG